MVEITEKNFEETIESLLLAGGSDSPIQGDAAVREVATARENMCQVASVDGCHLITTNPNA